MKKAAITNTRMSIAFFSIDLMGGNYSLFFLYGYFTQSLYEKGSNHWIFDRLGILKIVSFFKSRASSVFYQNILIWTFQHESLMW